MKSKNCILRNSGNVKTTRYQSDFFRYRWKMAMSYYNVCVSWIMLPKCVNYVTMINAKLLRSGKRKALNAIICEKPMKFIWQIIEWSIQSSVNFDFTFHWLRILNFTLWITLPLWMHHYEKRCWLIVSLSRGPKVYPNIAIIYIDD